ncbi:MAG: hypothetical protein KTR31_10480 [Myxococcales bacterium]|nr:hypothetical protein [Myxococcales bacterium]
MRLLVIVAMTGCRLGIVEFGAVPDPPPPRTGTGAGNNGGDDPQDPTGTQLDVLLGGCNDAALPPTFSFEALTTGWSDGVVLHVLRTADRAHEVHPLELADTDPGGTWDQWKIGPVLMGQLPPYEPGTTSALDCVGDALSYGLILYSDDERVTDCGVLGADPDAAEDLLVQLHPSISQFGCQRL